MECLVAEMTEGAVQKVICSAPSSTPWHLWVTAVILTLSLGVAIAGLLNAKAIARKKATLDLIETSEYTSHYQEMRATFSYYRRRKGGFAPIRDPGSEARLKKDRNEILSYLNYYEMVSIGIDRGVFDKDIYKAWMAGPFVRDWNAAREFIQGERWKWNDCDEKWEYYERTFENFQKVALCLFLLILL